MSTNDAYCPVTATMKVIGGKWKPIILWLLRDQVRRFGEIKRFIPKVTQKMLTQQLRELENDKIVNRKVYPVVPPKVEYSLSKYGKTLIPILDSMATWGTEHKESLKTPWNQPIASTSRP